MNVILPQETHRPASFVTSIIAITLHQSESYHRSYLHNNYLPYSGYLHYLYHCFHYQNYLQFLYLQVHYQEKYHLHH